MLASIGSKNKFHLFRGLLASVTSKSCYKSTRLSFIDTLVNRDTGTYGIMALELPDSTVFRLFLNGLRRLLILLPGVIDLSLDKVTFDTKKDGPISSTDLGPILRGGL